MKTIEKTAFEIYSEAETALIPLDEVIALLRMVCSEYDLDDRSLDKQQQRRLINNYHTIGQMLSLATRTLEGVINDFYSIERTTELPSDDETSHNK